MKTFQDQCKTLAPLETFDPAAFQGDADVPQGVCNLVLMMALIYDDCNNLMYALTLHNESKPSYHPQRDRVWGTWNGLDSHLFRLLAGLLHELLTKIAENEQAVQHPFFRQVVKQMPRVARQAWASVTAVASGSRPTDPLGKGLLFLRNKVASHYDPKAIARGYRHHFIDERLDDRAFISRGGNVNSWATRFYFADAAATGYQRVIFGKNDAARLMRDVAKLWTEVNFTLIHLVDGFIQKRGFAYQAVDG